MKSYQKVIMIILITSGIVFTYSALIVNILNSNALYVRENENDEWDGFIYIKGNSGWFDAKTAGIVTGSGIFSEPYIIKDLIIDANGLRGIVIENSDAYFNIENCTFYNGGLNYGCWGPCFDWSGAITLINVSNAQIFDNYCSVSKSGIYLKECYNNNIFGNILKNNSIGIYIEWSNDTIISGNTINNNWNAGIVISGNNNNISGNTLNYNKFQIYLGRWGQPQKSSFNLSINGNILNNCSLEIGGSLEALSSHNIDTNVVNGKPLYYYINKTNLCPSNFTNAGQVYLINCKDSRISNLNVSNIEDVEGISLYFSNNNNISGNIGGLSLSKCNNNNISGIEGRISLSECNNNTVSGNVLNGEGIYLDYSDNNNISENILNGERIYLSYSDNNIISGNIFNSHPDEDCSYGIHLNDSNNNTISGNNIVNYHIGIMIYFSHNNTILDNNLNDNNVGIGIRGISNTIKGNNVSNCYQGISIYGGEYNTVTGNFISTNEYGIYIEFWCDLLPIHNTISDNVFQNNNQDYLEEEKDCGELGPFPLFPEYLFRNIFFLLCNLYIGPFIFLGFVSLVLIPRSKVSNERKKKTLSGFKFKKKLTDIKSKTEIKTKPLNINQEKVLAGKALQNKSKTLIVNQEKDKLLEINQEKMLQGKTLQVYWYILSHRRAGVREIQKSLNFSSPGTASYQVKKLSEAGIISKDDKTEKYYVNKDLKKGMLGFYIRIGFFMIPRFSLYLMINIMGFVGYLFFASTYGDTFITNPGSILLLIFLIFGTAVFIFESIKIWKRKPTKFR